jgi:hypothetical protein
MWVRAAPNSVIASNPRINCYFIRHSPDSWWFVASIAPSGVSDNGKLRAGA